MQDVRQVEARRVDDEGNAHALLQRGQGGKEFIGDPDRLEVMRQEQWRDLRVHCPRITHDRQVRARTQGLLEIGFTQMNPLEDRAACPPAVSSRVRKLGNLSYQRIVTRGDPACAGHGAGCSG